MAKPSERWWARPQIWVEVFAILNVGFLTFDIYLAHSVNQFRNQAEYIPLIFSATAPLLLIVALAVRYRWPAVWKDLGYLVGWIGGAGWARPGLSFTCESHFFYERTLRSLTYSAPFAAPLAYTGLGFLLIMNRMVDPETHRMGAMGVVAGAGRLRREFRLQPGRSRRQRILQSAGVGACRGQRHRGRFSSGAADDARLSRQYIDLCALILLLEAGVGLWGFILACRGNLRGPSVHAFDNFIYGAPPMAPLLFPNLMVLGIIALWQLSQS